MRHVIRALPRRPSVRRSVLAATLVASATFGSTVAAQSDGGAALHRLQAGQAAFGDARIRERRTGFDLWSPEYAFDHHAFRVSAEYAYTRYEYEGLPTRNRDLHHLHLPLQWRDRSDRWRVALTPVVAASSNVFKDLSGRGGRKDFDLYARWEYQQWADATRGWRVAVLRDAAFGAPRLYPAAAILRRGERWTVELGLPTTRATWIPRDDVTLGVTVFPDGGKWHVVSDERSGAEFDYLARAWRGAVTAGWSPWRSLRIEMQAGIEFERHHEFEDDTGARIDRGAGSARYLRLQASFRL